MSLYFPAEMYNSKPLVKHQIFTLIPLCTTKWYTTYDSVYSILEPTEEEEAE